LTRCADLIQSGIDCIQIGDATVEYGAGFRLYLTSKLCAPHFLPDVAVKVWMAAAAAAA
jgi:ATP-binding dynein motor region